MCKVLDMSSIAYYRWRKCPDKATTLDQQVVEVYNESHKRYGSPRIKAELNKKGLLISLKTAAKIMCRSGLKSIVRNGYRMCTTDTNHTYKVSSNLLDRCFSSGLPSQKWVGDLTCIPAYGGGYM